MSDMIKTVEDLGNFWSWCFNPNTPKHTADKAKIEGVMVSTAIRRKVMLDIDQGRITLNGRVRKMEFTNLGGGVWRCQVVEIDTTGEQEQ